MSDPLGRPEAAPRRIFGDKEPVEVFRPEYEKEPPKERVVAAAKECRRLAEERRWAVFPGEGPILAALAYMIAKRSPKAPGRTLLEMRVEHILEDELAAALGMSA